MKLKIFISYSSKYNKKIAGDIKRFFEEYKNIKCFVAHDDILQGSEWEKEILKKLDETDYFMPIHTAHLETSCWCQQEAGYAFAKGKRIIPLIPNIDGTDPIGFYAKFQGFKIKIDDLRNSIRLLLIKENIIKPSTATEIDKRIYLFLKSNSFEEAGRLARSVLEFEDNFEKADILRIVDIALDNDQVRNSYKARNVLESFFKRHSGIISKEKIEKFLE